MAAPTRVPARKQNDVEAKARAGSSTAVQSFVDRRPVALAQRQLVELASQSSRVAAQRQLVELASQSPRVAAQRAQQAVIRNEPTAQRAAEDVETTPAALGQRAEPPSNRTGLPDGLKAGIEHHSGMSMDDVRVHYNSSHPAQLSALAYAQGNDIHLGPGQERHLPHEAWHVVQQRAGLVRATMQMAGVGVNDDAGLEREADAMGARALSAGGAIAVQRKQELLSSGDSVPGSSRAPVRHAGGLESVSNGRAGPTGPAPVAAGGLMQMKWIHDGHSEWLVWDRQLDGLRWFYIPGVDLMYYEVEEIAEHQADLVKTAGVEHARTREKWATLGFGQGDWSESDGELVPFIPAPEEKIKLGNSKREITRESLESQARGFLKSTSSGSSEVLYKEFLNKAGPLFESALKELEQPGTINRNIVLRLIEVFTAYDQKAHEDAEVLKQTIDEKYGGENNAEKKIAREKNVVLIENFKKAAVQEMVSVAQDKFAKALIEIAKLHGAENQYDALTAANNLLTRFNGNSSMSALHKLVEVYNMVRARLMALNIRKATPIKAAPGKLATGEFSLEAPALNLGSLVSVLEQNYDVLSRRTGAVTDESVIHIHEVDLAFVQVFMGITEAYANPSAEDGDELVFGGGGGVGEKVFAADHTGSMGFRSDVKKREERFYGLIFPKNFVKHFGMDIRDKGTFDKAGKEQSKLSGSVREPNEAEFAQHFMQAMNGDPAIEIPMDKLFFIRAETSTPGGQVDIHFGWRDMLINESKMHHPDFFRQHVLGVVEFTKTGRIIRYQRLR